MSKQCVACGMPMDKPADFAAGDGARDYCCHCARPDGSMQSYEERLESMAGFISRTRGLDETAARHAARAIMDDLPAWKDPST